MVQPGVLGIPIEVNSLYKIQLVCNEFGWYRYVGLKVLSWFIVIDMFVVVLYVFV